MLKKIITFLFTVLYLQQFGQIYPSSVTTTLYQPYTIFLDEYANPLIPKIKATVVFTDFTEPSWNIYLKLKITGPNFTIESKPGVKPPQPFNVIPGVPFEISGADLDWYFNNNNLNFSGISRAQLEANNNRLPEGFYTYCFEAIDYETNRKISLPGCGSAYLALNDPPIVIAPACGNAIENLTQQNILFQWQISNTNGNLNVSSLNYQIDIYEVNNNYSNPQNAIVNNQALPIWQSQPISQNSYLYGPAEPPLEKGKRYVFTVRAIEQGKSQIKNNGYSQACWFYYGYPEGGTIELIALPDRHQLTLSEDADFSWKKPSNTINATQMVGYQFRIVPLNDGQDPENAIINNTPFFQYDVQPSTAPVKNMYLPTEDMMRMARMKPYVWQVKGSSGQQEIAKSPVYKFTGPPVIEKFYAGGFEVTVTSLSAYDSLTYVVSGKGKMPLNTSGESPEFSFSNIKLEPIGSNTWVMVNGRIDDKIILSPFVLTPDSVTANKNSEFITDSIHVTIQRVSLGGFISWKFPLGVTGNTIPYLNAKRQNLMLSSAYKLSSQDYNTLSQNYKYTLLEPGGFTMQVDNTSQVFVYNSAYNLRFNGVVELPASVKDGVSSTVKVPFYDAGQLFYIDQKDINTSEGIRLIANTNMDLKPRDYVFDFSEKRSPGDFSADSTWKGFYMYKAGLLIPVNAEDTKQISANKELNEPVYNMSNDSTVMHVNQNGLTFKAGISYNPVTDTLKFNTFPAVDNMFRLSITDNLVNLSHLTGRIRIPVLDTAGAFPYFVKLDEYGFGTGYLINGLNNYAFTFNAAGSQEQKINITITRALFKNNNRLEMEMNLVWPHFSISLNQLQKFCAWGNGNIGFETPNGICALTYQATGKASSYDIQTDRVGCGRVANLYSFGISSRIVMAEDISGDDGAPIVNSYTMYKNPLLTGDYTTMAFNMGNDSLSVNPDSVRNPVSDNLTTNLGQTLNDMGIPTGSGDGSGGDVSGAGGGNGGNAIIPNSVYLDMLKIVTMAETFVQFIKDEDKPKAQDYITVIKQVLNSDEVKKLVNTSPEQLVNDLIQEAADAIVNKINQPIQNISNQACTKIRSSINNTVVLPVTNRIDSVIGKAMNRVRDQLVDAVDDENVKGIIKTTVNTVKINLCNSVRNSINTAVETNVTSKITGFIEVGITGKITGYVRTEIKTVANNIITTGIGNSVNLNNIIQNAGTMFKDVGDTIADAVKSINLNTIRNTAENVADDVVKGIDFNQIGEQILSDLAAQGVSSVLTSALAGQLGGVGGGIAQAALSTVKFDFTNVGDKLKNGQIDQIVKFDFTNIYITTNAADVQGKLKFTKDDPIYGDSFQAMVMVKIKVPDKNNPISGTLKFINGKTTQGPVFPYWFFSGKVLGLGLKMGSIPFTIDGFEGSVYSKMQKIGQSDPTPFANNKYGVGARIFLFDTPMNGKIINFDVGLDVVINNGGFAVELNGTANIGNLKSSGNSNSSEPGGAFGGGNGGGATLFSVATATGYIGYYSEDKRFQGAFGVKFNTAPLLCAGGEMGVKVDGKNHTWEVYIGKRATPVEIKLLCKDNLKSGAYFDMKNTGIEAGFFKTVSVAGETPWIGGDNLKIRGWANFGFSIDAHTNISFEPSFKINEAYISASASAGIGFDYETPVNSGSVTIAGVSLSGSLLYINHERAELHGQMDGSVTILNHDFGVGMRVDYDIDHMQKISG